jgi:perosamine synthetase
MTWPNYTKACRSAVDQLLRRGGSLSAYRSNPLFPTWTGPSKGSWAERLEREAERKFRVRHAISVNSGTAALHAALASLRLPPGSTVVSSPFSFSATSSAILLAGYTPRYADVCPYTFNITPETVKKVLTKDVKAILPVSLFGGLSDVHGLKQFGLPVVEDAAQAVGARDQHGYSGTHADVGCYSFNGGKQLPAGEAGMVVTNDDRKAEAIRLFMNHGENFHSKVVGLNYRPNEVTACIAYHGLLELEERNQRRIDLVRIVSNETSRDLRPIPFWPLGKSHVYYVVPLKVKAGTRDKFIKRMAKRGIPVGAGYITPPLHKYPAFRKYARGPLPVVEDLSSKTLCILSTLTPDRPLSYARKVAKAMRESLR